MSNRDRLIVRQVKVRVKWSCSRVNLQTRMHVRAHACLRAYVHIYVSVCVDERLCAGVQHTRKAEKNGEVEIVPMRSSAKIRKQSPVSLPLRLSSCVCLSSHLRPPRWPSG